MRYGRERECASAVCVCELSEMNREGFINLLHKTKRKEETKKLLMNKIYCRMKFIVTRHQWV